MEWEIAVMPVYKKRPAMSDDTPVWRYLGLDAAITTIQSRRLRLTRVDTFETHSRAPCPRPRLIARFRSFLEQHQLGR